MILIGIIVTILGIGGFLLKLTGSGTVALQVALDKMPLGLGGWAILAAIGLIVIMMNRRPAD